jgi:NTE family protein
MAVEKDIALVFSGGGARGAYQIGVWQALVELGLTHKIGAVYGTSVGAINGAAYMQGDIDKAKEIWSSLTYQNVFADLPESENRLSRKNLKWIREAIKQKGLDVQPLKNLLYTSLDEKIIRSIPMDFGLVVFDLTNRRPRYLLREEMEAGKLIDYVIASASFPVFQAHRIDDYVYTDGGVYDNRPINFVEDRPKIKKVICIDVTMARHFWKNKKVRSGVEVIYIRPTRLLGSPLAFKSLRINRNMDLGYRDGIDQLGRWLKN